MEGFAKVLLIFFVVGVLLCAGLDVWGPDVQKLSRDAPGAYKSFSNNVSPTRRRLIEVNQELEDVKNTWPRTDVEQRRITELYKEKEELEKLIRDSDHK